MIIAFANHKGGTGKTTSTINIGRALCNSGKKVLLIDLDPQGNLSYSLGFGEQKNTVADFMLQNYVFDDVACLVKGMYLLPSNTSLYKNIKTIENAEHGTYLLRNSLSEISGNFDYILIDCPPGMSVYTYNALNAAQGVIIPLVFDILSIQGLDQVLIWIKQLKEESNPDLNIIGVLGVIVNENRKLTEEVLVYIRDNYQVNIFNNRVRNNVKAAEAPSFGMSVIDYAPASISARDYLNVANELKTLVEYQTQLT